MLWILQKDFYFWQRLQFVSNKRTLNMPYLSVVIISLVVLVLKSRGLKGCI